jgi:hypothetical protein
MADQQLTAEQIAKATLEYKKQQDTLEALNDQFDEIEKNLNNLAKQSVQFAKANKDSVRQVSELKGIYNELSRNARTLSSLTEDYSAGLLKTKDVTKTLSNLANTEDRIQRQITQSLKDKNTKLAGSLQLQLKSLEKERKIALLLEQENKTIDKKVGLTGKLLSSLSKIPILGDALDFDTINQKMRLAALDGKKVFAAASKEIGKQLKDSLQDPVVKFTLGLKLVKSGLNDIKKAFDIFLEFDKIFTDTARSLGMSTDQIRQMTNAAKFTGSQFGSNAYTAEQINKAITESNTQLGLSVDLGAATTTEFTAMTNQMGLSAEEATNIYKLGLLNNKSLKDTNKSIAAGIVAAQKSTGVQINAKQVFQEIGKLSAGILVKFRQNPEALAKAVAQAKALGVNLEQVDKVGESLLNFESSIENELKAELITGKQLNLEKARYAALTGDQVTLTRELADQVGSLEDFQNMNVIQQKSLAEAFGMTKDEVASMLQSQEVYNKLGDVSGKSAEEQLKLAKEKGLSEEDSLVVNLQQQAASEKIAAAFDNFKAAISGILVGMKPLLDIFVSLSKHAGLVSFALGVMATISLAKTIGGLVLMTSQLMAIGAAKTAGAGADAASTASLAVQATEAGIIATEEGIIAGEKTAGAAADAASAVAKTAQVAAAGTQAATEGIIAGEKTAGAAADVTSATAKAAQAAAAGTQAATEAAITAEKGAQAVASGIINPVTAVIGLALAGIIAAAVYSSSKKKPKMAAGGIIMPTPGGMDVTVGEAGKPEAIIPLNSSKAPGMLGGNIDLSPMIAAINEVRNAVNTLASKPAPQFTLQVDGKAIGTAVGKQIETGTAQSQYTSYKVA